MSEASTGLKMAVLVKYIPDPNGISIDAVTRGPVFSGTMAVNTYDTYAVAEAIELKERYGGEVTIVTAGPASAREAILRGLATGADRGIHLQAEADVLAGIDSLTLARLIADRLRGEAFDLVLAGQQSEDLETGQLGPQVAALLDLPHVSLVTSLEADVDARSLRIRRDSEGRKQLIGVDLPAMLLMLTGRDGEQRHPTLKGMIQAKRKPVDVVEVNASALGEPVMAWSDPVAPVREREAVIVEGQPAAEAAKALATWLREKHLV
ncbi:MAG: electron transfer flavoprotein subunit beta/FixA family protein [Thermomicrobiales bacterium]